MTATVVGMQGQQPQVEIGKANPEGAKYRKLWDQSAYRAVSPGERGLPRLLAHMPLTADSQVIDFGCGTGRAALKLFQQKGCAVTMVDFARNCLDPDVKTALTEHPTKLSFRQHDLETPFPMTAGYGLCTDVMEHIPPDKVNRVLANILQAANRVWFQISTVPDELGSLIGEPLHLSVHSYSWWMEQFMKLGCTIYYAEQFPAHILIYASAWTPVEEVMARGHVNIEHEVKREQIAHNIAQGWKTIEPCQVQEHEEVILVGGGWSLDSQLDTIRRLRADGKKLVTLNNAYHWCLNHGLTPSATVVMDGRAFNARFVTPVVEGCKYLICSQVHPSVFEGLPKDRTFIWHDADTRTFDLLNAQYGEGQYFAIPGGSTSFLRALPLLRMLGYQKFHVFGADSCLSPDKQHHHAYAQPENDHNWIFPVTVNQGKVFYCQPWMFCQAREFHHMINEMGHLFELELYGDGLLRHMLETAASLPLTVVEEGGFEYGTRHMDTVSVSEGTHGDAGG